MSLGIASLRTVSIRGMAAIRFLNTSELLTMSEVRQVMQICEMIREKYTSSSPGVCVCENMYAWMCIYSRVRVIVCKYVCVDVYVCACMCDMCECVCMRACVWVCINVYVCACVCVHVYVRVPVNLYVCMCYTR